VTRELPAAARLAAFAAALVVAFGAAYGVGAAAGPVPSAAPDVDSAAGAGHDVGHSAAAGSTAEVDDQLPGLTAVEAGYALRPEVTALPAGDSVPFAFTVTDPAGAPLTAYEPTHERDLHLVVVRRDLSSFQHVHPELAPDGTWTSDLDLSEPGTYRAFADFAPADGEPLTLGTDLFVAGEFAPAALPAPERTAVVDGYEVTLAGDPRPGEESMLTFTVSRDRRPVTDLQPYLGAFGHLVALRTGDLAYLHTHPADDAGAGGSGGPEVALGTVFPTAGTYRLYLDFQVDDEVRTAAFTVEVPLPSAAEPPGDRATSDTTPHGH
jgi:hypothetical protein